MAEPAGPRVWVIPDEEKDFYADHTLRYRASPEKYGSVERVSLTRRYLEGLPPYTQEKQLYSRDQRELHLNSTLATPQKQQVRPASASR